MIVRLLTATMGVVGLSVKERSKAIPIAPFVLFRCQWQRLF